MHSSRIVLPTAVAVFWGCLPQCMLGYTLGLGLGTPPGVGLETPHVWAWRPPHWVCAWRPPLARPLNLPPRCGPRDPSALARPLNAPLGGGLETPLPCEQNS